MERTALPVADVTLGAPQAIGPVEVAAPVKLTSSSKLGYRPALDGVRGLAVLMVMFDHGGSFVWQSERLSGGGFGVDIFFVLSGFLITGILLEEWNAADRISLKRFYLRRCLRLLPALCLVLMTCSAYAIYCTLRSGNSLEVIGIWKSILFTMIYIPNLAIAFGWTHFNLLAHTWSLGIEEQFYFLWPLCLIWLLKLRLSLQRIGLLLVVAIGLIMVNRLILLSIGTSPDVLNLRPDTRADSLLVGCAAAVLWQQGWTRLFRWSNYFWPSIGLIAIMVAFRPVIAYAVPMGLSTVLAVATAIVILELLNNGRTANLFRFPLLAYSGRISYGLYLWHLLVYSLCAPLLIRWQVASGISLLLLFALTFLVAILSFHFIEAPCLRLKRKFSATS